MQRKSMQAARSWIASFALGAAACASEVMPDVGGPAQGGVGAGGASEGGTSANTAGANAAGNGGVGGTAGAMSNQAGLGGTGAGTGNGGSGAEPPIGGAGGAVTTGGVAGSGGASGAGMGGVGGGSSGGGGKAGASGAGGAAGAGGASGAGGGGGGGGAGSVNLIQNGGFETNTNGWSIFGGGTATISTATAQSHSGARSLMITGRTQAYQGPQYSVLSVVTPGESYTLSVWGRLSSTTPTGSLTVTVHYACAGGTSDGDNYFRWVETTEGSASSWSQLVATQVFPACAGAGTMTSASIYVESPTATLAYYIDDVTLTTP